MMEYKGATSCDKKLIPKAKSCNNGPPLRLRGERKSFNVNDAVKSLDLALCRLRKGRMVSDCSVHKSPVRRGRTIADILMDSKNVASNYAQGTDNSSLMSMNFSHYELMRNLSRSNCNSEGAFSDSTSTFVNPTERSMKDERLERYFRSVEMWSRHSRDRPSGIHFDMPEK